MRRLASVLYVLLGQAWAQNTPLLSLPAQVAGNAVSASKPASVTPRQQAENTQRDRLQILEEERRQTVTNLMLLQNAFLHAVDKAETRTKIARFEGDLRALDAEISRVKKEPVFVIKTGSKVAVQQASVRSPSPPPPPPTSEPSAFEPWDVFKNFSTKGPSS